MIVASAEGVGQSDPDAFDLFAQRVPATVLRCGDDSEELRLATAGRAIRLSIASGTLLEGPVRLCFHMSGIRLLSVRLRALAAFDSFMQDGHIPILPTPLASSPRRMAMVLAAMDGIARFWTQREIAVALFGEQIVAADWNGPSDFLRSRVRRLIAWVADLSGDAYLDLLHNNRISAYFSTACARRRADEASSAR